MREAIYVGLDCLLDFRFSLYLLMNRNAALESLKDGSYHNRKNDRLNGINHNIFREVYAKKSEELLQMSVMTNIVTKIRLALKETVLSLSAENSTLRPRIDINIYPYTFSDEVSEEFIRGIYLSIIPDGLDDVDVNLIRISPSSLSINSCFEQYRAMFIYDYVEWFVTQEKEISKIKPLHDMAIISPLLYDGDEYDPEELEKMIQDGNDPIILMEKTMELIGINLTLVEPKYFSILNGYAS